jgi:hypothetical protein
MPFDAAAATFFSLAAFAFQRAFARLPDDAACPLPPPLRRGDALLPPPRRRRLRDAAPCRHVWHAAAATVATPSPCLPFCIAVPAAFFVSYAAFSLFSLSFIFIMPLSFLSLIIFIDYHFFHFRHFLSLFFFFTSAIDIFFAFFRHFIGFTPKAIVHFLLHWLSRHAIFAIAAIVSLIVLLTRDIYAFFHYLLSFLSSSH